MAKMSGNARSAGFRRAREALGPRPYEALAALADYGLSDSEIARYHGVPIEALTDLRAFWGIAPGA